MLQQNSYRTPAMPLLMGFTPQTPIQIGGMNEQFIYDDIMQVTEYNMASIGTKCYKKTWTKKAKGQCEDKKNELDDTKIK